MLNEMSLRIRGLKCFVDDTFELNKLTVLSGANGAGKSTVIQALLLMRLGTENAAFYQEDDGYEASAVVPLNEKYGLSLGVIEEIVNSNALDVDIELSLEGHRFIIGQYEHNLPGVARIKHYCQNPQDDFVLDGGFYYLNAERMGPRYSYEFTYQDLDHCGAIGENTARLLMQHSMDAVDKRKVLDSEKNGNFQIRIDEWLNYISPGISVKVEPIGKRNGQVVLRNGQYNQMSVATNIGFGISYALPVVVDGLLAKEGKMLLVENPEAHLHPKAQSNLGFFLGKMAAAGVRVVIETHSEHIINGIRRAALSGFGLEPEDVNIYFFAGFKEGESAQYRKIRIEKDGSLDDFPKDFFDQVRQDLQEIMMLARRR